MIIACTNNNVNTILFDSVKTSYPGGKMIDKYLEECGSCTISEDVRVSLCPYCMAQKVIKGKWKLLIFWHLQDGTKRFNELSRLIPSTQATLARQLKELEQDGVIQRKTYDVIPPKVEYSLSPLGISFKSVMESMNQWGQEYLNNMGMVTFDSVES